ARRRAEWTPCTRPACSRHGGGRARLGAAGCPSPVARRAVSPRRARDRRGLPWLVCTASGAFTALDLPDHAGLHPLDEGYLSRMAEPGLPYSDDSDLGLLPDCGGPSPGAFWICHENAITHLATRSPSRSSRRHRGPGLRRLRPG